MSAVDTKSHTRTDIARDLRNLGLATGDIALVRVALKAVGPLEGRAAEVLIDALLDVVGESGTILGLSHTEATRRSDTTTIFRRDAPSVTGGFVAAMLGHEGAHRSLHPTNSMVAIGRDAESLLEGHDETSTCFAPMRRLIHADAKMLLLGCIESSPGFSTVHLVYEDMGLATKSLMSGLDGSYYEKDGELRWFSKRDVPGCSMGFGHFYPLYRQQQVLSSAKVGDAESMLIGCRDAYEIEFAAVKQDRTISLCDNPDCLSCRGSKLFNLADMPRFYATRPRMLAGLLRAQAQRMAGRG
jgi:aminoglycoside 3-N-acetyltransferase